MLDANTTGQIFDISKRVYDLLDTAIKIGVPIFFALITSLVTWYFTIKTTKKNHEHELKKLEKNYEHELNKLEKNHEKEIEKLEKSNEYDKDKNKIQIKIKILEEAFEISEKHILAATELRNRFYNLTKKNIYLDDLGKEDINYYQRYNKASDDFYNSFNASNQAIAKLILLGFKNAAQNLSNFSNLIREEFNQIGNNDKKFMTTEEFKIFNDIFLKNKENYYDIIHECFEKLR